MNPIIVLANKLTNFIFKREKRKSYFHLLDSMPEEYKPDIQNRENSPYKEFWVKEQYDRIT